MNESTSRNGKIIKLFLFSFTISISMRLRFFCHCERDLTLIQRGYILSAVEEGLSLR